jgi:translation initiation factor 2B subunit (eIF-2B alpha/beta/delta family)
VVLVHGLSRVVVTVLKAAMDAGKNFTVVVTEGRPEASGCHMAEQLLAKGIPVSLPTIARSRARSLTVMRLAVQGTQEILGRPSTV